MKSYLTIYISLFFLVCSVSNVNAQSSPAVLELEKNKAKAISEENFVLAGDLSKQIKALKEKEIQDKAKVIAAQNRKAIRLKELTILENEKKAAVAAQDFAKAAEIKKKILKLTEIDDLDKQKKEAIAKQDYKLAGELKKKIEKLVEIEDLEFQKKDAVTNQDYKLAGELNAKIIALRDGKSIQNSASSTTSVSEPGASVYKQNTNTSNSVLYVKGENSKIRKAEDNATSSIVYRRSSLYTMMVQDPSRNYSNVIAKTFADSPLPGKFNDHDLNEKVISASGGGDQYSSIHNYLNTNSVAREIVAKWFNRSAKGTFNMDLIAYRGNYNATIADLKIASLSARGNAMLSDAGEDLIGNTFVVINDFKYTNKEEVANKAKAGLNILSGLSSLAGGPDLSNVNTLASAGLTVAGKGYIIKNTSYLFRLVWNEEIAASFYQDYWIDDSNFDPAKKAAFENSNLFTLKYIGYENSIADLQSSAFTNKSEEELISRATVKAVNSGIAKLQRKFEEFRTKTPLYTADPLTAKIGLKEGLEPGDMFEVLEAVQDPTGKVNYVRKGIIRVDNQIWDNRLEAEELDQNTQLGNQYTTFKGSGNYYTGMLIRQIN